MEQCSMHCMLEERVKRLEENTSETNLKQAVIDTKLESIKEGIKEFKNESKEAFKVISEKIDKMAEQPKERIYNILSAVISTLIGGTLIGLATYFFMRGGH